MRSLPSELSATEDPIAEPDPEPPPPPPAAKGKSGAAPPITPAAPHPRLSKRGVLWTRLSGSIDSRWTVPQPVPYVRVGESAPLKGRELTLSPWQREWGFRGKVSIACFNSAPSTCSLPLQCLHFHRYSPQA